MIPLTIVRRDGYYTVTITGYSINIWSFRETLNVVYLYDENGKLVGAVNKGSFNVTIKDE